MSPLAPLEFAFCQGLRDLARGAGPGAPLGLVVAVSGGRDSMALLEIAARVARHRVALDALDAPDALDALDARGTGGGTETARAGTGAALGGARDAPRARHRIAIRVVHFHHGTRPGGNDADEAFVLDRSLALGVPVAVHRFDGAATRGNFHARARDWRYALLESERAALRDTLGGRRSGARTWVLTAHHARDAVESMLLHLARGAGPEGLRGIATLRPDARLWRPFARTTEAEIANYASVRKLAWREDPSNASLEYDRNKVRLRVLPALAEINPAYERAFLRFAMALDATLDQALGSGHAPRLDVTPEAPPPTAASHLKGRVKAEPQDLPNAELREPATAAPPGTGLPRDRELVVRFPEHRPPTSVSPRGPESRGDDGATSAEGDPSALRRRALADASGPALEGFASAIRALTLAHWKNIAGHVDKARRAPPGSRNARGLRVPLPDGLEVLVFANALRFLFAESSPRDRRRDGRRGAPEDGARE